MANDELLDDLLLDWEAARARGQPVPPEQLCRACPELLETLRRRIDALSSLATVLDLSPYAGEASAETNSDAAKESAGEPLGSGDQRAPERTPSPPGFEILSELQRGGMGIVYKARHIALDRLVALKMLLGGARARPQDLARFEVEARAVARLHHPNIVQIYDVGSVAGCPYLVLEFVPGGDLEDALAGRIGRTLPATQAATLLETVARAIHHAHQNGIVHRDVKPSNILLTEHHVGPTGELELGQPKVTDFGLARQLDSGQRLTAAGSVIGTPSYMAPEQAAGRTDLIGPPTDVYALGAVLYQLLTGVPPVEAECEWESTRQTLEDEPKLPRERCPNVPPELETICMRCLRKDPAQRYADGGQLADDLHNFLAGLPLQVPPPAPAQLSGRGRISRRAWLAGAAGVAAAAAGIGLARRWLGAPSGPPIRVGLIHSLTGTMSLSERPVVEAEQLALEELNRAGGLLGRPVEAVIADGRSQETVFAQEAERLIAEEKVSVLVGCWTSASRKAVVEVVQRFDHLLLYPVQFEGLEESPNVVYFGPCPNQQILPAVTWARNELGKQRFFLIGSDYIFPRAAAAIVADELGQHGLEPAGEVYLPLGGGPLHDAMQKIKAANPDVILNFINGDSNVAFCRRLHGEGISPATTPTLSFSLSEQELTSIDFDLMDGNYLVSGYFQSLPGEANRRFLTALQAGSRAALIATDAMATAYGAVHLWARAVKAAGSAAPTAVHSVIASQELEGPVGPVRLDPASFYAYRFFRLGRIRRSNGIELVDSSAEPLAPLPFPPTRTPDEWRRFLAEWHSRWGDHWSVPN